MPLVPALGAIHCGSDFSPNKVGGGANRISGKVCIPLGGRCLRVAKELADHGQAHAHPSGDAGKAVAQIMDADVGQVCLGA